MYKHLIINYIYYFMIDILVSNLFEVTHEFFDEANIRIFLLKEDQLHEDVSGNKWRKLQYNLAEATRLGCEGLLSFGGAHSNHIAALAAAGEMYGFRTAAYIRGEQTTDTPTLEYARRKSMDLNFVNRAVYTRYNNGDWADLQEPFKNYYILPEGGGNTLGVRGCMDIVLTHPELANSIWCVACGTGTTMAGMVHGLAQLGRGSVLGFPVLRGGFMAQEVSKKIASYGAFASDFVPHWQVVEGYEMGGYAAYSTELVAFINTFYDRYGVPLDPIYTGKMMFGLFDMIRYKRIAPGSTLVAVHTGGLQGIEGYNRRYGSAIIRHEK